MHIYENPHEESYTLVHQLWADFLQLNTAAVMLP